MPLLGEFGCRTPGCPARAELGAILRVENGTFEGTNHSPALGRDRFPGDYVRDRLLGYPSAIRHFSNAIRHDPEFVDAYYHRGIAHDCTRDYDAAVADFTEMIKLQPSNGTACRRSVIVEPRQRARRLVGSLTAASQPRGGSVCFTTTGPSRRGRSP